MEMANSTPVCGKIFIQRKDELGIVVPDSFEIAELHRYSGFFRQEVRNLDIYSFIFPLSYKIDLSFIEHADPDRISPFSEFKVDKIFEQAADIDIPRSQQTVAQTEIGKVILIEILQMFFSLNPVPADSMNQKGLFKVPQVGYHGIRGDRYFFILKIGSNISCGGQIAAVVKNV
jgi:hypothetical protein